MESACGRGTEGDKHRMKIKWKPSRKQIIVYGVTLILSLLYVFVGHHVAMKGMLTISDPEMNLVPYKAKVEKILSREALPEEEGGGFRIFFDAKILSGEKKGQVVTALQESDPYTPVQLKEVSYGDKVLVYETNVEDVGASWMLGEYLRTDALIWLGVLFCVGLLIFGRMKGLNTLVSLVFTCLSVFIVFIPSVLSGQNIYLWSSLTCLFITVMTLLFINGADRKTLAAGIGCFSGVAVSGLLTLVMGQLLHLTGMLDEDSMYLYLLHEDRPVDLKAVIFASIIIGAIGAIMDVAMSVSSSLMEIRSKAGTMSRRELFQSGITIGRDMMGTMANTLVLAYIGSSLSVTLLLVVYSSSMLALLNREMIIVEILNALVGSLGILLTIPLTSLVCALLFAGKKEGLPQEESGSDGEAENPAPDMKEDFLSIDSFSEKNDSYDGI